MKTELMARMDGVSTDTLPVHFATKEIVFPD